MCLKNPQNKSEHIAKFMSDHKIFRRFIVLSFLFAFFEVMFWTQRMVETGVLTGEWIGPTFVGAIVSGFVLIAQGYANNATTHRKDG